MEGLSDEQIFRERENSNFQLLGKDTKKVGDKRRFNTRRNSKNERDN